ncbi:MAG: hypothetical protein ACXVBE_09570 [Bdellovibrionota bacterium]
MNKNLIALAFLVFGWSSAHGSELFTGSRSCEFDKIQIAGTLDRNILKVSNAGIFNVEDLDENPIFAESWPKDGVVEYGLSIHRAGEHGVPSESFNVPMNLKSGENPSLLQIASKNRDGSTAIKNVNGSCRFQAL